MSHAQNQTMSEHTPHNELAVGEILRRTRVHYGRTVKEVESALHIRADQIEAIEQGHVEKLPARVYAIGFVRSYSEFLGLDGDKMVALFKTQSAHQTNNPELQFPVTASDSKIPPLWLVIICIVLAGFLATTLLSLGGEDREMVEHIPQVPDALKPEAINAQQQTTAQPLGPPAPPPSATVAAATAPAQPQQNGITLKIKQNSWVEIRDKNGKKILSRVLKAGDQYFVPDRASLTMSLGNAGGVEITVDGQTLGKIGESAKIVRNIPLSGASLRERYGLQPQDSSMQEGQPKIPLDNNAQ